MRHLFLPALALGAMSLLPTLTLAQEPAAGAATGAVGGAVIGGVVGGPVGAVIGAGVGGTVGAASGEASQRNKDVVIEEQRAPVTERTCLESSGRTECVETRR